jgi:uncharacterized protein (DUF736 family)
MDKKISKWTKNQNGALWKKETPKGKYLSGYVEIKGVQHRVVIFPNKYKNQQKQPDFILYNPFE